MNIFFQDPSYSEVREMLHKKLEELRKEYGDSDELNEKFIKEDLERHAKN